jgi:hypothetical protein
VQENFFAGSYDANTYMETIEERLRQCTWKTDLTLQVTRYYQGKTVTGRTSCRRAPRWIKYEITCSAVKSVKPLVFWINTQCIGFSKEDYYAVRALLNLWLKKIEGKRT